MQIIPKIKLNWALRIPKYRQVIGEYSPIFPSRLVDEKISYSTFEHTFLYYMLYNGSYMSTAKAMKNLAEACFMKLPS